MIVRPPRIGLPRTGQTTVYATGDDGTCQAGVRAANARASELVDNGNGTITDYATGLMWPKQTEIVIPGAVGVHPTNQIQVARGNWANNTAYAKADAAKDTTDSTYRICAVAHTSAAAGTFAADRTAYPTYWRQTIWTASAANLVTPATMIWTAFIAACLGSDWGGSGLSYAGYNDWRPPNLQEVYSLLNLGAAAAPYSHAAFPKMINRLFSSSTLKSDTTQAFQLSIWDGLVVCGAKSTARYGYPVRGGHRKAYP
jgi:hypothetical protein